MSLQHCKRCTGCRSTSESATNWCASFTRPCTPMTHQSTWAPWSASIRQAGHCALPAPPCAWLYLAPVWLVQTAASRCPLLLSGMRCLLTSITVRRSGLSKIILKLIYSDNILVKHHCHHCWSLQSFNLRTHLLRQHFSQTLIFYVTVVFLVVKRIETVLFCSFCA